MKPGSKNNTQSYSFSFFPVSVCVSIVSLTISMAICVKIQVICMHRPIRKCNHWTVVAAIVDGDTEHFKIIAIYSRIRHVPHTIFISIYNFRHIFALYILVSVMTMRHRLVLLQHYYCCNHSFVLVIFSHICFRIRVDSTSKCILVGFIYCTLAPCHPLILLIPRQTEKKMKLKCIGSVLCLVTNLCDISIKILKVFRQKLNNINY